MDIISSGSSTEKTTCSAIENVHPHHWCGQHKFAIDSPTSIYNYCSSNKKEKSAMCRIAEIARFNKIKHVYNLQDESGPAHKKLFTVRLILTPAEFFEGSGTSIKKAQQASAEIALKNTTLPQPSEKNNKRKNTEITKPHRILQNVCRSLQYTAPHYISCNPPVYPDPGCPVPEHILLPPAAVAMYGTPYASLPIDPMRPHGPKLQAVIVNINGKSIATGVGESYPLAKQDAALKAMTVLSPLLKDYSIFNRCELQQSDAEIEKIPMHKQKSVISYIHEKAHQMKMNVIFETLKEEGPPHERVYVVRCAFVTSFNTVKTEATGKGRKKKTAQQEACKELLAQLDQAETNDDLFLLASHVCKVQKKISAMNREPKRKTIVKDKKMDPLYGHQINPVSRLIQISQVKNQKHPTFQLISEHGSSKFKEFVIQVQYDKEVQEGRGPNKRLAKRAAAEEMLKTIGYIKPSPLPGKSLLKKNTGKISDKISSDDNNLLCVETASPKDNGIKVANLDTEFLVDKDVELSNSENERRHVTFNSEVKACPPPGDQNYPKSIITNLKKDAIVEGKIRRLKRSKENRRCLLPEEIEKLKKQAENFLEQFDSASVQNGATTTTAHFFLDQLSVLFKFSVQYTTFPEASPSQHFTIVSLGLEEPLVGHGTGSSISIADEKAAFAALDKLKELKCCKS